MKEKELQQRLISLVQENSLLEAITNQGDLRDRLIELLDDTSLPTVPLDSYMEGKYLQAALEVIHGLDSYTLISGDPVRNIALDKGKRLFPDVLLYNEKEGSLILLELKRDGQTEREAMTELQGYTQAIYNTFPFLAHCQLHCVLIATDFRPLVDHALSLEVTRNQPALIGLIPSLEGDRLTFQIHFPTSWSALGQGYFPARSFIGHTCKLSLHPWVSMTKDEQMQRFLHIHDLVTRAGERYGSHGFCIFWLNTEPDPEVCMHITFYLLDPHVFLPAAQRMKFPLNEHSPLLQHLQDLPAEGRVNTAHHTTLKIWKQAWTYLRDQFKTEWTEPSFWEDDLMDDSTKLYREPFHYSSWGLVNELIRDFYIAPHCRDRFFSPQTQALGLGGYQSSFVGLQIFNYFSEISLFPQGRFLPSQLFAFALHLRQALDVGVDLRTEYHENQRPLESYAYWHNLVLTDALREIGERTQDLNTTTPEIPIMPLVFSAEGVPDDFEATYIAFANWFLGEFLVSEKNPYHYYAFQLGWMYAPYFDNNKRPGMSPESLVKAKEEVDCFGFHWFMHLMQQLASETIPWPNPKNTSVVAEAEAMGHLQQLLGTAENLATAGINRIEKLLDALPECNWEHQLQDHILPLMDWQYRSAFHELSPLKGKENVIPNFKWLKRKARERFEKGAQYTTFFVLPNNNLGIANLPEGLQIDQSPLTQDDEIIYLEILPGGISKLMHTTWEYLENQYFKQLDS